MTERPTQPIAKNQIRDPLAELEKATLSDAVNASGSFANSEVSERSLDNSLMSDSSGNYSADNLTLIEGQGEAVLAPQAEVTKKSRLLKVKPLRVGIIAGEVSGDTLGARFIEDMQRLHPRVEFYGVGGHAMQSAGLKSVFPMQRLNHMGLMEVVKHLPDLFKAKEELLQLFEHHQIDMFVGIDAPDFNLRMAKPLKAKGVYTVQYVSPSVWAWRERRIHKIMSATHQVLCLFPFELPVYQENMHPADCVGHPLLTKITRAQDMLATRRDLVWQQAPLKESFLKRGVSSVIALLPGSRSGEISRIAPVMFDMVKMLLEKDSSLHFLIPAVDHTKQKQILDILKRYHASVEEAVSVLVDTTQKDLNLQVMAASDMVVLASGTVTLEAMLLHKPMVVVYKLNSMTYAIAKRLMKTDLYALPNILAGKAVVPELIQDEANPVKMAQHVLDLMADKNAAHQVQQLKVVERKLREMSAFGAADAALSGYVFHASDVASAQAEQVHAAAAKSA